MESKDLLWQSLSRALDLVKQRPHHFLIERSPADPHGLDCETFNRLAIEVGLSEVEILEVSSDPAKVAERLAHPDYASPVEWFRLGPNVRSMDPAAIFQGVVERLEAWRAKRVGQLTIKGKAKPTCNDHGKRCKRGCASELILTAILEHHKYDDGKHGSIGNWAPIGVTELVTMLKNKVAKGTVSEWFRTEFGGHNRYAVACHQETLLPKLQALNGDFAGFMNPSDFLE